MNLSVKVGYKTISDCNGVMTVAFFADDFLTCIVAGESYSMLHKLVEMFRGK